MRALTTVVALLAIACGIFLLLATNGLVALTAVDLGALALAASAALFIAAGIIWRRTVPWLTALFIPGLLALALAVLLFYADRAGWREAWMLLLLPVIAVGAAFLGMYFLGPHARWLLSLGLFIGAPALLLLAILLSLFTALLPARLFGAVVLIVLGVLLFFLPKSRALQRI